MIPLNYTRELKTRHSVDVLVAGGGPAGIAASISAARQGASVRLIEASTCLGGMGTAGMVPAFMTFTDGVNFLAGGVGRQVYDALHKCGGLIQPRQGIKADELVWDSISRR